MAEMSTAAENMLGPENLSIKPPSSESPVPIKQHNDDVPAGARASSKSQELETTPEPAPLSSQSQKENQGANNGVERVLEEVQVKPEEDEMREAKIKEEFQQTEETLVGKVKIKPMTSLVETNAPNPQPGVHPFFAGFDDHIRSLIMSRQPQFGMNSPLIQTPPHFMYYDNSTNMNLKKMLNGHKMVRSPISRHPTFRPYVPINVPRPPRSQVPFRNSFSTQTPPMFLRSQPDVSASPSTSYQWLPQSRPPVSNFTPQNASHAQNVTTPKNLSVPNFVPGKNLTSKYTPPNNLPTQIVNTSNKPPSSFPVSHNLIVSNVAPPQPNKVSTSSSTDDLENHSSGNTVIIKTEVDLGIDSKEELQVTLDQSSDMGTHMEMPATAMPTSHEVASGLEIPETKPLIITGDVVGSTKEQHKRNTDYDLPPYSTKGPLLCKCCDFRCNRKKKLKEHFDSMHTAENFYKCFYCIKKNLPVFHHKSVHDLEHHVAKVHRGEKRWQCRYCYKTYKCHASYKAHMEMSCSQSRPYACHMCTFTCVTEAALEKHIKSHEKMQETQLCPFCSKTFKKFYLKRHLITVHAPPEEKPFHCVSCDFASGAQSTLEIHYRRTGHDKQFRCDQCDYACRTKLSIKHHIRTVHDSTKLVCGVDGCKVKCQNMRSLSAHRRIHSMSESELFTCPDEECSKKFTTPQSLRFHTLKTKHHKPFKCTDCALRFIKEESLNRHIQSIHVPNILKKLEKSPTREPVCVKNVVDVFNYVEGLGGKTGFETAQMCTEDDSVTNFGCWLGISGFGDITKSDCDNEVSTLADSEGKSENEDPRKKLDEDEDEDYCKLVPVTCLVEVKDEGEETKTEDGEALILVKKEEEEKEHDESEYQHINPEVSCLVECQQQTTTDSSTDYNENEPQETEYFAGSNLVKVEMEESDAS